MTIWAILLAAGSGSRLTTDTSHPSLTNGYLPSWPKCKQFLSHQGVPLFWHSARTLARIPELSGIIFVFPPQFSPRDPSDYHCFESPEAVEARYQTLVNEQQRELPLGLTWRIALGGARRQDSVANGLVKVPVSCEHVLIHDSARPFVSPALTARVVDGLAHGHAGVIPGIPVNDTIKRVDAHSMVLETPDRSCLRAVQTPQGFSLHPLVAAHQRALAEGWEVTDDASLLERCGHEVCIVEGEEANKKITNPGDVTLLREQSMSKDGMRQDLIPCAGLGYDVHRYGGERPFVLGGVPIATHIRIAAHSDGDTLIHALIDAILGCIGGGDVGRLFPDTDPAFDNIASGVLLSEVLELAQAARLRLTNVDITIVAQAPRVAPHREAIAANLAKLLELPRQWINVKATTEEHLGFTGEKKGIKVFAHVSGLKPGDI